ncbi:unnamed protein product [Brassica rapa]|uniref:DUF1985 domain-containing protein n=1 Tax=Brassica campestris TaxID=3711 RepID=A0A3P5ZR17_BRACM|nr:unnamed protein product [Brassica rapa]VDC82602.1 unnamed protein product [Brassica rapa]
MVSARLVDFPEDIEDETDVELPQMMFADGEEPVGVRVLTYQSSRSISSIVNSLNEDEIRYLRASSFEMRVSRVVKMLRKNTVTDPDIRIKLACLALVSSVLLSTNINMKMLKEYAELLVDIEDFMSYPWGRLAFDMLMTSIKNIDEIALSQNTTALKGFALALQLVIVEAVPALTEVVQDALSSSESESEDDETEYHVCKAKRKTLNPAHAREVDRKAFQMLVDPTERKRTLPSLPLHLHAP